MAVTCVLVEDGCGEDRTGDDVREWYVTACDDDGEQVDGTAQVTAYSRGAALDAAEKMAAQYGGVEIADC